MGNPPDPRGCGERRLKLDPDEACRRAPTLSRQGLSEDKDQVRWWDKDGDKNAEFTTDSDGNFTVKLDVPDFDPGKQMIEVSVGDLDEEVAYTLESGAPSTDPTAEPTEPAAEPRPSLADEKTRNRPRPPKQPRLRATRHRPPKAADPGPPTASTGLPSGSDSARARPRPRQRRCEGADVVQAARRSPEVRHLHAVQDRQQ